VLAYFATIGKAKKGASSAAGTVQGTAIWAAPPTHISPNTPTDINLVIQLQKFDGKGAAVGTPYAPDDATAVMFDMTVSKGNGNISALSFSGNPVPVNIDVTPATPAKDRAASTDEHGIVRITVRLEEGTTATLSARAIPTSNPNAVNNKGWTGPTAAAPITFSAP